MCELFAMSSRVPTHVRFSLDEFARHGGATAPNADGWGIAFYEGRDARLLREATPASDSALARFVGQHELLSDLVVSHIRRATLGVPALRNTHPFQRELGGQVHIFAHNGKLPDYEERGYDLGSYRPVGETNSELSFCVLLAQLAPLWRAARPPSLSQRLQVVSSFAATLREFGPANFLYADGDYLFAHAHRRRQGQEDRFEPPGLHTLARTCPCRPRHQAPGLEFGDCSEPQRVLLVASVPLTDEAWQPVPKGTVLVARAGEVVAKADADGKLWVAPAPEAR